MHTYIEGIERPETAYKQAIRRLCIGIWWSLIAVVIGAPLLGVPVPAAIIQVATLVVLAVQFLHESCTIEGESCPATASTKQSEQRSV